MHDEFVQKTNPSENDLDLGKSQFEQKKLRESREKRTDLDSANQSG